MWTPPSAFNTLWTQPHHLYIFRIFDVREGKCISALHISLQSHWQSPDTRSSSSPLCPVKAMKYLAEQCRNSKGTHSPSKTEDHYYDWEEGNSQVNTTAFKRSCYFKSEAFTFSYQLQTDYPRAFQIWLSCFMKNTYSIRLAASLFTSYSVFILISHAL